MGEIWNNTNISLIHKDILNNPNKIIVYNLSKSLVSHPSNSSRVKLICIDQIDLFIIKYNTIKIRVLL